MKILIECRQSKLSTRCMERQELSKANLMQTLLCHDFNIYNSKGVTSTAFFSVGFDLNCDFETEKCNWSTNLTSSYMWKYASGKTKTPNTGPPNDHTTRLCKYLHHV